MIDLQKVYQDINAAPWLNILPTQHLYLYIVANACAGCLTISLKQLGEATGLSVKQVRTALNNLSNTGFLARERGTEEGTREGHSALIPSKSAITICNYDKYVVPFIDKKQEQGHERGARERAREEGTIKAAQETTNQTLPTAHPAPTINFTEFCKFFNSEMDKANATITRLRTLSPQRQAALQARLREHGKQAIATAIKNAANSDFLNGKNNRDFIASFDWIFRPNNFPKVVDGNYDNKNTSYNGYTTFPNRFPTKADADRAAAESLAQSTRDYLNGNLPF